MKNIIEKLVIMSDGTETRAIHYKQDGTKQEGCAKRNLADEYNFAEGAFLAMNRAGVHAKNMETTSGPVLKNIYCLTFFCLIEDRNRHFKKWHDYICMISEESRAMVIYEAGKTDKSLIKIARPNIKLGEKDDDWYKVADAVKEKIQKTLGGFYIASSFKKTKCRFPNENCFKKLFCLK